MEEKKLERVRVTGTHHRRCDQGEVTIGGLISEEMESIEAFTLGSCWIRVSEDGRIERRERFAELPGPIEDPYILPKWVSLVDWTKEAPFLCNPTPPLPDEPKPQYACPAIIVKYLGGYNKTPYESEARRLQSYGFECLRSRRGNDGHFWEIWYLPGDYHARGRLKDAMTLKCESAEQISTAINFLCRNVSFGTLDICYQRAAMVID